GEGESGLQALPQGAGQGEGEGESGLKALPQGEGEGEGESGLKALPQGETGEVGEGDGQGPEPILWDLGREGIQAAIQENTEEFARCFEAWLAVQPETGGKLVVGFTIAVPEDADPEDGARVVRVEPEDSELENAFMEGCVLAVFEGLRFTAPEDGGEVKVRYPLRFSQP
ncbi:MAG: AgmX/PglI C-terminal domain-containing protein, partial [Pseudomonadota bacterium]